MQQGETDLVAAGGLLARPYRLGLLAEFLGRAGQLEAGLAALKEALDLADHNEDRAYLPELHRLKGALLWQQGAAVAEVETHFERALAVARQQQSRSLLLRAAMSLGRLWQTQGKSRQAHKAVKALYDQFSEGFDTPVLVQAKTLLAELQ